MQTQIKQPDIVQVFDCYEDRIYKKIISGFIFSSKVEIRRDRIRDWKQWNIVCDEMPDKIFLNGKPYKLERE